MWFTDNQFKLHNIIFIKKIINNLLEYVAGSNKGQTQVGDVFNSPFGLAPVDEKYTSSQVEENATVVSNTITLGWGPVVPGTIVVTATANDGTVTKYFDDGNGNLYTGTPAAKVTNFDNGAARVTVNVGAASQAKASAVGYGLAVDKQVKPAGSGINPIYDANTSASIDVTGITAITGAASIVVTYSYNNVVIP